MGAKTGLLVYADGAAPGLLKRVGRPDRERTAEMMRRLYPGWEVDAAAGSDLWDAVYPPKGRAYEGSWPGVELICDQRVMIDLPSRLPDELVSAGRGRRMVLHAMHSVVDWLAFGVWENGRLVRSLSLSPPLRGPRRRLPGRCGNGSRPSRTTLDSGETRCRTRTDRRLAERAGPVAPSARAPLCS